MKLLPIIISIILFSATSASASTHEDLTSPGKVYEGNCNIIAIAGEVTVAEDCSYNTMSKIISNNEQSFVTFHKKTNQISAVWFNRSKFTTKGTTKIFEATSITTTTTDRQGVDPKSSDITGKCISDTKDDSFFCATFEKGSSVGFFGKLVN